MVATLSALPIWVRLTASVVVAMVLSLGGITFWSVRYQQQLAIQQASEFAEGSTHMIMAGIAAMMATGDAADLTGFLDQFRESRSITSLKVVPGEAVTQQFGKGTRAPRQIDAVEQQVLDHGRPHSGIDEVAGKLVYRAIVPMAASQNFMGRDCLKCHETRAGTVLGVVSLQIGLDHIRQASRDFAAKALGGAAAFGALVVGLLYVYFARTVSRPLAEVDAQIRDISEGHGDLTRRLHVRSQDEVGRLGTSFNGFVEKLHAVMVEVRRTANHAAGAARELSGAADQLASGAQEQASALEETAASLEEITGTVKQTADNARQANQLAVGSQEVAERGGQVVTGAVQSMAEINHASRKIADIITTIDEIAFQTNLLALNAAVEAARAGEQGRGFAVVAAEVRNLAQRSASAAKEIKGLIQDSVGKVDVGSEQVSKSGETLTEIVSSVKRVTDIIGEIAAASQEQSSGIDQVNRAVTQLDQVTQSNAAQTEELSSTAQALATEAEQLQTLVGRFKLDTGPVAAIAPRGNARPATARSLAPTEPPRAAPPALTGAHTRNGSAHGPDDGFEEF